MGWQPIETCPEFEPVLIWAPEINRGSDSAEVAIRVADGWWTNGGPNGGIDLSFPAPPTHWMPLPPAPISFTFDGEDDPWNEALQHAEECIVGLAKTLGENERDKALWEAVDAVRSNRR